MLALLNKVIYRAEHLGVNVVIMDLSNRQCGGGPIEGLDLPLNPSLLISDITEALFFSEFHNW